MTGTWIALTKVHWQIDSDGAMSWKEIELLQTENRRRLNEGRGIHLDEKVKTYHLSAARVRPCRSLLEVVDWLRGIFILIA